MTEEAMKQKLNEKYILYQVLAQNLEGLKQQLELVEEQMIELKSTSMSMEELGRMDDSNEIFLQLGSGCFGKGKITDSKKILVNMGAGVFIDKDEKDAKSFVEGNFRELEKAGLQIEEQLKRIVVQMNELASEIQQMAQRGE